MTRDCVDISIQKETCDGLNKLMLDLKLETYDEAIRKYLSSWKMSKRLLELFAEDVENR
jgi:hypothetical protein